MRILSLLVMILALGVAAQEPKPQSITVGFWNVENLFDAVDDPGTHDDEFATWLDNDLYQKKLDALAEVVIAMGEGKGPDILGLAEVENRRVVQDLVARLPNPSDYAVVHVEGRDHRSIEVALISRLPVRSAQSHFVYEGARDILQVNLDVAGHELIVLVNHWKSRSGGVQATSPWRLVCASRAYQVYRDIARNNPDSDVILIGDFNDSPDDESLTRGLHATADVASVTADPTAGALYNATSALVGKQKGSHWYNGEWTFLDQMIVSRGLMVGDGLRYRANSLTTMTLDGKLLWNNDRPFRFGNAHTRERGYSDHLPIIATFEAMPVATSAIAPSHRHRLMATVWYQASAEARALYYQAFAAARMQYDADRERLPNEEKFAVVVDVDETVLDNSPYQAGLLFSGRNYPEGWQQWVDAASAQATPGSIEFLRHVEATGGEVFYITNRKQAEKQGTLRNLQRLGFPFADDTHVICRETSSEKVTRRRALIAAGYHIPVLIGDNLGDFSGVFDDLDVDARALKVDSMASQFGHRFIVLPNPMYGNWEGALYNYDYRQPPAVLESLTIHGLRPWDHAAE